MKNLLLILILFGAAIQISFANCVVRNAAGKYYYFEGLNCERNFPTIIPPTQCWNVASPPNSTNSIDDAKVEDVDGHLIFKVKVQGTWYDVAEVDSEFVIPDLSDMYETDGSGLD